MLGFEHKSGRRETRQSLTRNVSPPLDADHLLQSMYSFNQIGLFGHRLVDQALACNPDIGVAVVLARDMVVVAIDDFTSHLKERQTRSTGRSSA